MVFHVIRGVYSKKGDGIARAATGPNAITGRQSPGIIGLGGQECCKIVLKRTAVDAAGTGAKNLPEESVLR
jgi:hypothetical protein